MTTHLAWRNPDGELGAPVHGVGERLPEGAGAGERVALAGAVEGVVGGEDAAAGGGAEAADHDGGVARGGARGVGAAPDQLDALGGLLAVATLAGEGPQQDGHVVRVESLIV